MKTELLKPLFIKCQGCCILLLDSNSVSHYVLAHSQTDYTYNTEVYTLQEAYTQFPLRVLMKDS